MLDPTRLAPVSLAALLAILALDASEAADIRSIAPDTTAYVFPYPTANMEGLTVGVTKRKLYYDQYFRLDGPIEPGDAEKLAALVGGLDRMNEAVLVLNSPGGAFGESLKLADVVSLRKLATFVGPGDTCLSGCALVFLAGSKELLRGLPPKAERTLHVRGRVGLHAPFNSALPANVSTAGLDVGALAEMFFSQSREAIRELQSRIDEWHISPLTVFEFLGYGPNEFYELDRFARVHRDDTSLVTDTVSYPREINALQAAAGCDYVFTQNLGPQYNYGWNIAHLTAPDRFFQGSSLIGANLRTAAEAAAMRRSPRGYTFEAIVSGRGPFTCRVFKSPKGGWQVKTNGQYPLLDDPRTNFSPLIDQKSPYPLTSITALGPGLPWTAAFGDDLYIEERDQVEALVPAGYKDARGPSFDCGGELDPAARVICRFTTLARFDAVMAGMYKERLARDAAEQERQRQWIQLRDAACPSAESDLDDAMQMLMAGYCLLDLTIGRIIQMGG